MYYITEACVVEWILVYVIFTQIFTINKGMEHMFVGCLCFTLHTNLFISVTFIMNLVIICVPVVVYVISSCCYLCVFIVIIML